MNKKLVNGSPFLFGIAFLMGCPSENNGSAACGRVGHRAITVAVSNPEMLSMDNVTASVANMTETCGSEGNSDDSPDGGLENFRCDGLAEGTYVVRVASGKLTWTKSIHVSFDDCVPEPKTLAFDLGSDETD